MVLIDWLSRIAALGSGFFPTAPSVQSSMQHLCSPRFLQDARCENNDRQFSMAENHEAADATHSLIAPHKRLHSLFPEVGVHVFCLVSFLALEYEAR